MGRLGGKVIPIARELFVHSFGRRVLRLSGSLPRLGCQPAVFLSLRHSPSINVPGILESPAAIPVHRSIARSKEKAAFDGETRLKGFRASFGLEGTCGSALATSAGEEAEPDDAGSEQQARGWQWQRAQAGYLELLEFCEPV